MATKSLILNEVLRYNLGTKNMWTTGYCARLLHELTGNGLTKTEQPAEYHEGWRAASEWLYSISARKCPVCGGPVIGTAKKRYCSDACRQRAYRERKG